MHCADQGREGSRSPSVRSEDDCRTEVILRVLLRGCDIPQERSLQWIIGGLIADLTRSQFETSITRPTKDFTEWDASTSTLVLYVERAERGKYLFLYSFKNSLETQFSCQLC